MRYIIFFLLFLPIVGAVTVAPASLEENDNTIMVINTLNEKATYQITGDASPKEFTLNPKERKIVEVEHSKKEAMLYVDEQTSSNIVSSAAIKVSPRKNEGFLNSFHARTGIPPKSIIICTLGGVILIATILLIWKFLK